MYLNFVVLTLLFGKGKFILFVHVENNERFLEFQIMRKREKKMKQNGMIFKVLN